jgi:ribosomal protein S18 acetylase RimI-like enzyme
VAVSPVRETVDGLLRDGRFVFFRPIRPSDKAALKRGMKLLSPESRYHRFFAAVDHLSPKQLRYFTEVDYHDHFAWMAFLAGAKPPMALGVARYVRLLDDPEAAEAAVTVLDDYQRQGLGIALLRLLAGSAIERGIRRFVMAVMGDNEAMMQLLQTAGATVDRWEEGIAYLHVELPGTPEELAQTPVPKILRATAEGKLRGRAGPHGVGIRFLGDDA